VFSLNLTVFNCVTGSFDEILKDAILGDNVKFVQIILNQGVVMREYLTLNRLMGLYRAVRLTPFIID
jgi:hypothetical protein